MSHKPFSEKSPEIRTARLVLRPLVPSDLDDMLPLLCSNKVNATYMLPDFTAREDAIKLFERLRILSHSAEHLLFGIYLADQLIGFLNDTGFSDGMVEVGYVISPDHWNRGYATEALTAVIEELFRLGFTTVRAGFFEENPASGRVMEKSGMHRIDLTEDIDYRGKTHRCLYCEIAN